MRYQFAIVLASACINAFAFAEAPSFSPTDMINAGEEHHHMLFRECTNLKLEDAQKAAIKSAIEALHKDPARGTLKAAAEAYKKVLADPTSDRTSGDNAATALNAEVGKMSALHTAFLNNVFFTILKADQRAAGAECLKHFHHHHHGHGGHHHGHEGHHPHPGGEGHPKP